MTHSSISIQFDVFFQWEKNAIRILISAVFDAHDRSY